MQRELEQSGILGVFENIMLKISAYQNKNHTGILPVWFSGVRSKECFSIGGSLSWMRFEQSTGIKQGRSLKRYYRRYILKVSVMCCHWCHDFFYLLFE